MALESMSLGTVEISRVLEWEGSFAPVQALFPDSTREQWATHRDELSPHFWDEDLDFFRCAMSTWVVRSEGKIILVDTGIGNDKYRPYAPPMNYLQTDYLAELARAGVEPVDVDIVVNTHIHSDHAGWNTRLVDGVWVPTFPRATYLFNRADVDYWNPINGQNPVAVIGGVPAHLANQNMFEDSIAPILEAGQALLWDEEYRIDSNLGLHITPGHTPGSAILVVESESDSGVFTGDILHTPMQIHHPGLTSRFDEKAEQAAATRQGLLAWAADHDAVIFPAHFPGHPAVQVGRDGDGFTVSGFPFPVTA